MSYSPEVYTKINELYSAKRAAAISGLEERIARALRLIPQLSQIEEQLGATGLRVMAALKEKDGGKMLAQVRRENDALVAARAKLLVENGLPADYCEPHFECPLCGDTGYADGKRCICMKKELYRAQAALSGLGGLLGRQTFENFDLSFYDDRENAEKALNACRDFAENGVKSGDNLLLMGATGLGKTHLSTAVADRVMQKDGSVIYESAPNVLADFRYEQFGRGFNDRTPVRTDKYFSADLLIIDDLGSEMPGALAVSVLYNLINTRLNARLSTLLNTNLSPAELTERYDRRITSRLLGEYDIHELTGSDIRLQKIQTD